MYSQRIKLDILNHNGPDLFARVGEGSVRTIYAVIMSGDESITINNPVICARIVKPDKTFVYTPATVTSEAGEPTEIRFNIPGAASQVSGIGCYDIRIQENGESNIVYTAEGRFVIDDDMITEEMLESVAEVNGLIFPDDFYTRDDNVAIIDDNVISTDKTWSSSKIAAEISSPDYTETATGNPIELTDAANAPVISCSTAITGYQSGSGTPSPDNIRPIVAFSSGEIEVRGKNLFDGVIEAGAINPATGEDMPQTDRYRAKNYIPVYPTNEYIFSKNGTAQPLNISFYGIDKSFVSSMTTANGKISVPANVWYIRFYYNADINVQSGLQLEKGSTPTPYEPYTSTTHTTTFPDDIYRGREDVVNGSVESELIKVVFDGSNDEIWSVQNSGAGYNFYIQIADAKGSQGASDGLISNMFPANSIQAPQRDTIYISSGKYLNVTSGASLNINTVEDWRSWLSSHNLEVIYVINNAPVTSSVTPTNLPIRTLSGYTHIESSTGSMDVEYIKSGAQSLVNLIEAVTR